MTEHITTAPKDGTKILCVCSDGKTRYCWWFGCNDVDGCWMTEEVAEPVAWYATKRLSPSLKEQALQELDLLKGDANVHGLGFDAPAIRQALNQLPE